MEYSTYKPNEDNMNISINSTSVTLVLAISDRHKLLYLSGQDTGKSGLVKTANIFAQIREALTGIVTPRSPEKRVKLIEDLVRRGIVNESFKGRSMPEFWKDAWKLELHDEKFTYDTKAKFDETVRMYVDKYTAKGYSIINTKLPN